jgi:hypothetical protein
MCSFSFGYCLSYFDIRLLITPLASSNVDNLELQGYPLRSIYVYVLFVVKYNAVLSSCMTYHRVCI